MKEKSFLAGLIIIVLVGLVLIGCDKSPVESDTDGNSINSAALNAIITSESETLEQVGYDDGGEQLYFYDTEGLNGSENVLNTIKFGRKGEFRPESVEFEYFGNPGEPDTMAIATITRKFIGKFVIAEKDTTNAPEDYRIYTKTMDHTLVRKAVFERRHFTGSPRLDWKLDQVSMGMGYSTPTTLIIHEVKILGPAGQEFTMTSPLDYWMAKDSELPVFSRLDTVKVFVKLSNSNNYPPAPGTTVLLHHGVNGRLVRARRPLNDEGVYPDAAAGDGIFSGSWVVQRKPGLYHTVIDAIDNGTIFNATAPYNSLGWDTPYRVKF